MDLSVGLVITAVAVIVFFLVIFFRSSGRRSEEKLAETRQELQNALTTQGQSFNSQINHLMQTMTQQLGQVRQELHAGMASSGQITSDAQKNVAQQLHTASESVRQMSQQLGTVLKMGEDLSKASQTMQQVLGGAKSRGILGEIGLERMLEDSLPASAYELQYRFSTGDIVDAVVRTGDHLLSIDSKFPLDSYRRLLDTGEDARKEFAQAVRKHADAIAAKYILPGEHTFDVALMFVPSETVFYELLMSEDSKYGPLDTYCRKNSVIPVSPNSLYAYLRMILLGIRGLVMEENARKLQGQLGGLQKQLEIFSETFGKLGTHLRHAQQSYEEADSRLARIGGALDQMAEGALPETAPKSLESAATE
ncbi:MAG TPA: DNA recombination protein RmuC [Candidatus Baltobacteraceae bacterium]|nr:DNA recombination protein RmuC [Verrucomicrobiae bacterium]HTX14092.1 DNA recombination protein RmuC [Candidatus Baltobacteraceae bacterium]